MVVYVLIYNRCSEWSSYERFLGVFKTFEQLQSAALVHYTSLFHIPKYTSTPHFIARGYNDEYIFLTEELNVSPDLVEDVYTISLWEV